MNNSRLQYLFEQHFDKTASPEQRKELADLINDEASKDQVMQLFAAAWEKYQGDGVVVSAETTDQMLRNILGKGSSDDKVIPMKPAREFKWWRIAAAVILFFLIGGNWFLNKKTSEQLPIVKIPVNDVKPGSFKASLTLADGRKVVLDRDRKSVV